MFTAIDAPSFTPPFLTCYISSSCLLFVSFMMSLKTISSVWNNFQFCLTARQADTVKKIVLSHSSLRMRNRDKIQYCRSNFARRHVHTYTHTRTYTHLHHITDTLTKTYTRILLIVINCYTLINYIGNRVPQCYMTNLQLSVLFHFIT